MFFTVCKSEQIQLGHKSCDHGRQYQAHYLATELFEIPICPLRIKHLKAAQDVVQKPVNLFRYLISKSYGLIFVLLLGLWLTSQHLGNIRQAEAMIASPQVNDLYFADLHRINPRFDPIFRYSLLQVKAVQGDIITVQLGAILHTSPLSPFQYLTKGAYSGDSLISANTFEMKASHLQTYYDDGTFYNMKRPKGELIDGWLSTRFLHERDCDMCNSLRYK